MKKSDWIGLGSYFTKSPKDLKHGNFEAKTR